MQFKPKDFFSPLLMYQPRALVGLKNWILNQTVSCLSYRIPSTHYSYGMINALIAP